MWAGLAAVHLSAAASEAEVTEECPWVRFGGIVDELLELLHLLETVPAGERRAVYSRCPPLIDEIGKLNKPPLEVRKVKAWIFEASWHLRSLSGLVPTNSSKDEEHVAWALASLQGLQGTAAERINAN